MPRKYTSGWILLLTGFLAFTLTPGIVLAQNVSAGVIAQEYRDAAKGSWDIIYPYAERLFILLATIQVAWAAIILTLEKSDLQGWVTGLLRQVFFIGLSYAILVNASDWMWWLFESFSELGDKVNGGARMEPGDIFGKGVDIGVALLNNIPRLSIGSAIVLAIAAIVVIIAFSILAVTLVLALIEGAIAVVLGQILLGFGGSKWTVGYLEKYFGMVINVGLKVFTVYFLAGITKKITANWTALATAAGAQTNLVSELMGGSIILAIVVWSVPKFVSLIVGGAPSLGFSDAVGVTAAAATAAGTVVGGALKGAGAAAKVGSAARSSNAIGNGGNSPAAGSDGKAVPPPNSPSGHPGGSAAPARGNASAPPAGAASQAGGQTGAGTGASQADNTGGPAQEQSGGAAKQAGPDLISAAARQVASAGGMSQFVPSAVGSAGSLGGRNDGGQGMPGAESAVPPPSTASLSSRSDSGVSGSAPVGIGGAAAEALSAPAGMTTSTPMSPGGSESMAGLGGGSAASATASPTPSDRAPIGSGGVESAGASAAAATAAFGSVGAMTGTSSSAGAPAPTPPAAPQREHMPGIKDDYERMDAANRKNKLLLDQRNSSVRPGSRPPSRPKP